MFLTNLRQGFERLAFITSLACIVLGCFMGFDSLNEGYINDASFGFGFAFYGGVFFIYSSQILLWVVYGFAGERFKFKMNPLLFLK